MVDARDALMQGNLRRGVLEMATACEVATKELFAKKKIKFRAKTSTVVLLDADAKKAFGASFKQDNLKDWQNIKYLFRCRGDAVHQGNPQNVDIATLRAWWDSLETLIAWVRSH
jgi:hypothetical protein